MKQLAVALALVFGASTWSAEGGAEQDEIAVVVSRANPTSRVEQRELRPLFQTTRTEWSSGVRAVPLNLPEDNSLRMDFDRVILGLDPDGVKKYWIDRKIRGGERPPKKVPSSGAVLRIVAKDAGAIGYISSRDVDNSVKVVARVRGGRVVAP